MGNLAELLAPTRLEEVFGQDGAKRAITSWMAKDDFPRCQLYTGPVGTGKSTLAGIVARLAQGKDGWEDTDIREINAGTVGKVDDMRDLVKDSASRPFIGRYRAFILEEAQRATDAAQDAILVPMERNQSTMWILTSSEPEKLLPAIKSRCAAATFEMKPLNRQQMLELCERALIVANPPGTWSADEAAEFLYKKEVTSPREVLGCLDQWFSGVPLLEVVHKSIHEPLYNEVSTAVLSGNWLKTAGLLKQIKTPDFRAMVAVVSAKLSWALLDESVGPRADALATCLTGISNTQYQDGVAYGSLRGILYKTCRALSRG